MKKPTYKNINTPDNHVKSKTMKTVDGKKGLGTRKDKKPTASVGKIRKLGKGYTGGPSTGTIKKVSESPDMPRYSSSDQIFTADETFDHHDNFKTAKKGIMFKWLNNNGYRPKKDLQDGSKIFTNGVKRYVIRDNNDGTVSYAEMDEATSLREGHFDFNFEKVGSPAKSVSVKSRKLDKSDSSKGNVGKPKKKERRSMEGPSVSYQKVQESMSNLLGTSLDIKVPIFENTQAVETAKEVIRSQIEDNGAKRWMAMEYLRNLYSKVWLDRYWTELEDYSFEVAGDEEDESMDVVDSMPADDMMDSDVVADPYNADPMIDDVDFDDSLGYDQPVFGNGMATQGMNEPAMDEPAMDEDLAGDNLVEPPKYSNFDFSLDGGSNRIFNKKKLNTDIF